jgi:Protein of unknown function (DUF3618)
MSTQGHTPQKLREEIDATRRELGATVEQLAAKTAVKARLRERLEQVKDNLKRILERRPVRAVAIGSTAAVLFIGWTLLRRTD